MGTELDLRHGARLLAAAAAALFGVATLTGACALDRFGTSAAAGGQGGGKNPCDFCPGADTDCTMRTCEAGECGIADSFLGTMCNEDGGIVCDGAGNCLQCTDSGHCDGSQVCDQNHCVPAACVNGTADPGETDIDCGGDECAPCANGMICVGVDDCASLFCDCSTAPCLCKPCDSTGDCDPIGGYCDPNQDTCFPVKELGDGCGAGQECADGNCPPQDGICCDTSCDATCEACQASKTGGEDGTCALVTAGTDLDDECVDEGAASCGTDGYCSGVAQACNLYPMDAVCEDSTCSAGVETGVRTCDGDGPPCPASQGTDCWPYVCDTDACFTGCTGGGSECASGYDCDGNGVCKLENGANCNSDGDCASDTCNWEGVCCDSWCGGTCESCLGSYNGGNQGTCDFISANSDPYNECGAPPSNNCDGDGTC